MISTNNLTNMCSRSFQWVRFYQNRTIRCFFTNRMSPRQSDLHQAVQNCQIHSQRFFSTTSRLSVKFCGSGSGDDGVNVSEHQTKVNFKRLTVGDKRFGRHLAKVKSRKQREKSGLIFLEGWRLIQDAVGAGNTMNTLYFSSFEALKKLEEAVHIPEDTDVFKLHSSHLKLLSDVQTPSGVVGIFKRPKQGEVYIERDSVLPVTLICDNIRDPGNMGTLLRCAAAVGCQSVLTTNGCVDIWEAKVLRSATGAHFRVPVISGLSWELLSNYLPVDCSLYLADTPPVKPVGDVENNKPDNRDGTMDDELEYKVTQRGLHFMDYTSVSYSSCSHVAFVIGGETGLSSSALQLAMLHGGQAVYIPMSGQVDSLNSALAASVIMFEMKRQLRPT